jgi:hypothetical protein
MNFTNAQDYVPEAERNNCTIKERIRAGYHRLPYKEIPRIMINYLAMIQANKLNLFPVKGGISKYYSPHTILNQTNLDYTKHCVVPFGAYVQANHESTKMSSNVTRTLDAIYLRPAQNQQGVHKLMDLNSGQLISRNIVHKIPVTDVVIKAVKNMAYQQGFKSLKFKNRNSVIYHDADWIAGVDYDDPDDVENENEDEEYDNEEDENEDQLKQYEALEEQLKHIDPEEIEDIMRDARGETNPNMHEAHDNANEEQLEHLVEQQEEPVEYTRRSTRETRPIERLELKTSGKSHMQEQKKVNFKCDAGQQLEYHHNLITQNEPDEGQSKEYSPSDAMLMGSEHQSRQRRSVVRSTVPTQQRTKDLRTEGARCLKERNGPTTPKELLYSKINRRYDSVRTKKGATSADVPGRKAMWNR